MSTIKIAISKFRSLNTEIEMKYAGGTVQNPSLFIRNVEKQDEGFYICTATNDGGQGIPERAIYVKVMGNYLHKTCRTKIKF